MADIISLAEVRRLTASERWKSDEQREEPGGLSPALMRDMALLLLDVPLNGSPSSGAPWL
jgi:hypothetical protein